MSLLGDGSAEGLRLGRSQCRGGLLRLDLRHQIVVQCELDCLCSRTRAQVVRAGLQPALPTVEVHAGELAEHRGLQVDIERLRLANERSTVRSEVQDPLLRDLPDSLIDSLDVA